MEELELWADGDLVVPVKGEEERAFGLGLEAWALAIESLWAADLERERVSVEFEQFDVDGVSGRGAELLDVHVLIFGVVVIEIVRCVDYIECECVVFYCWKCEYFWCFVVGRIIFGVIFDECGFVCEDVVIG